VEFLRKLQANVEIGLLLLLITRSLAEVFRLEHITQGRVTLTEARPLVVGALVATIALGWAFITRSLRRHRLASGMVDGTIAVLFHYRVWFIAQSPQFEAPNDVGGRGSVDYSNRQAI